MSKSEKRQVQEDNQQGSIYVVGFPKSGNTWLTRLLADILQAPVRSGAMGAANEIAADINGELSLDHSGTYNIQKVHFLPNYFLNKVNEQPKRIVYIYRDFRDVAISSFFYFQYRGDEKSVMTQKKMTLLTGSPISLFRYLSNRRRFFKYIYNLCAEGIPNVENDFGTWEQHVNEWKIIKEQRADINFVCVSYEQLLNDTISVVSNLLYELNLKVPTDKKLQVSIGRQSFKSRKIAVKQLSNNSDAIFGKEFNISFLRKAAPGDWKNFLDKKSGAIIDKYNGNLLRELMYESDPRWFENINRELNNSSLS